MKEQCKLIILSYADEEMQRNAALTEENKIYVNTVLTLIRDEYHNQVNSGATEFILPSKISDTLNAMRPW
ncbi:hypothetical protein N9F67_00925 [bacterium]|mgnify:FL=1|jgi:hypothetical protein|nr:hypothetical protein [bacterium]|tara:strand:+ start:828 stop:1037 length:210 start_codon:yes stop_codon:yes gene_type:complete